MAEDASHTHERKHAAPCPTGILCRQVNGFVTEDVGHDLTPTSEVAERAPIRRRDEFVPARIARLDSDKPQRANRLRAVRRAEYMSGHRSSARASDSPLGPR